ncbi:MIZ/SP-RING zinc finger-domain-containing protein [Mycotypha africana]|uniref:MIZ/SP-RING zinc finger-domain-containing protein n=1 Tax=Mycotypha africana TaxID=64632 RepID=UPI002300B5E4|nr:MIZ/SP-RING zinc finger-domain-containing protein [Mycotypha africana]KAI8968544.1 MIZ/SP-RING zinc finger-domain-containing protein [Mycotypha africana]
MYSAVSFYVTPRPERKCEWPQNLSVEFNGQELGITKKMRIVLANGTPSYTGKDMPYDLTPHIVEGNNILRFRQNMLIPRNYLFSVSVYEQYSENYIKEVVANATISIDKSQQLIDKLLGSGSNQNDDDDDLVVIQSSVRLSLKCPITLKRIKQPVRGRNCRHVDCFDFLGYILINKIENAAWKCPHCNNTVGPKQLARDLLMESLLKELPGNVIEIEYTESHENYQISKMEDIESDNEDTKDSNDDQEHDNKPDDKRNIVKIALPKAVDVIDLISDSEDEDDRRPKDQPATKKQKRYRNKSFRQCSGSKELYDIYP